LETIFERIPESIMQSENDVFKEAITQKLLKKFLREGILENFDQNPLFRNNIVKTHCNYF
jgi:hypothetical protein